MIRSLTVRALRGFTTEQRFNFGTITLLSGRNGLGKTTIFDAIDWCLFGSSSRLGLEPESIPNLYAPAKTPRVVLSLGNSNGEHSVERTPLNVSFDAVSVSERGLIGSFVTD